MPRRMTTHHNGRDVRTVLVPLVLLPGFCVGCMGPAVRPSTEGAPVGMSLERRWMVSLPSRLQQTVWYGRMYMPDVMVSRPVVVGDRLCSVEAQHVGQSYARRLRLIERDIGTGRVLREYPLDWDVPEGHEPCRLLNLRGRRHISHRPWEASPTPGGILMPGRVGGGVSLSDVIRVSLLPPEMARALDDVGCFDSDGQVLIAAAAFTSGSGSTTRRWLGVAVVDPQPSRVLWRGRVEISFPVERHRGGVRVGRFGDVIIGRVFAETPRGPLRCREFFAGFDAASGRPLWSQAGPARRRPPAFSLVADSRCVYVHVEDTVVEAWDTRTGRPMWRQPVGGKVVADGLVHGDELITFVGDDYPTPESGTVVGPVAVGLAGAHRVRRWPGGVRAVLPPSFAVANDRIFYAPDDRIMAWPLDTEGEPLAWTCWTLPGGLLPRDAASDLWVLDGGFLGAYGRGTGTLTLLRAGGGT